MPDRSTSRIPRPVWLLALIVALGATAIVWRLGRGPSAVRRQQKEAAQMAAHTADPMAYVAARAGKTDAATVKELIQVYGSWAPRSETLEARQAVLDALLKQPSVRVALESVMAAVEDDSTPREMDPMWPYVVKGVASLWDAVTFKFGRDRMFIETRAKPHDVLVSSLAEVAANNPNKLADEQKTLLASDFIDMYPRLKPDQKPEVDRALMSLAGPDIVDILNGRQGDHLKVVSQQKQAIEQVLGGGKK